MSDGAHGATPATAATTRHPSRRDRWPARAVSWIAYAAARGVGVATLPFSVWRAATLFQWIGAALATVVPTLHNRVAPNLALIHPDWPEAQKRALIRDTVGHFFRLMMEYLHLRRFIRDVRLEVEGMEHLLAAEAAGRGALIVTAHYGNWEAIRVACLRAGLPSGIIYRPFNNRYVDAYTLSLIVDAGTPVMQKGPRGLRVMTRHLASGGRALLLADQRTSHAPQIPFLGQPAETLVVAPALATRTGAVLLTARARRLDREGRFHVKIEPPLDEGSPEAMMTEVNRRIGAWVEEEPAQWFWLHQRWRLSKPRKRRAGVGPRVRTPAPGMAGAEGVAAGDQPPAPPS
ncbi:MAG: lysophospholipid acyltransferase family protein [Pseudomonadota bacterium]